MPKATSTGTTIVGCVYDGGVVIAADTRATSGPIVADKVCFCHLALLHTTASQAPLSKASASFCDAHMISNSFCHKTELRETALHNLKHLVCRRRHGSRHRVHHRPHLLQSRTACAVDRAQATCCHLHDPAEAAPVPLSGPHWRVPGRRGRRSYGVASVHSPRPWLDRQAAIRDYGKWFISGDECLRVDMEAEPRPPGRH